jgi:hypothetical protein
LHTGGISVAGVTDAAAAQYCAAAAGPPPSTPFSAFEPLVLIFKVKLPGPALHRPVPRLPENVPDPDIDRFYPARRMRGVCAQKSVVFLSHLDSLRPIGTPEQLRQFRNIRGSNAIGRLKHLCKRRRLYLQGLVYFEIKRGAESRTGRLSDHVLEKQNCHLPRSRFRPSLSAEPSIRDVSQIYRLAQNKSLGNKGMVVVDARNPPPVQIRKLLLIGFVLRHNRGRPLSTEISRYGRSSNKLECVRETDGTLGLHVFGQRYSALGEIFVGQVLVKQKIRSCGAY